MYVHFIQKDFPETVLDFNGAVDLKNTPPIIAGHNNSVMIGGGSERTAPFYGVSPGSESTGFSLEAWIAPLSNAEVYVFDHESASVKWSDGIHFTVLVNGVDVTLSYKPDAIKAFHVVAVYSRYSMTLYVDSVAVESVTFDSPNTSGWTSGADVVIGSGAGRAVADGLAFYLRELPATTVRDHYLLGTTIPAVTTNLSSLSSTIYNFENQEQHLITKGVWPDWEPSSGTGVEVIDNAIYSESGGTWQTFVPLTDYQVIQRGQIEWSAEGTVNVEFSKDGGATWVAVANNSYLPGIQGSSPMTLDIRATLGAESTLYSLEVELYDSLAYETTIVGDAVAFEGDIVTAPAAYDQLEYRNNRGVKMFGDSMVTIDFDPDAEPVHAVDIWIRPDTVLGTVFWTDGGGGCGIELGEVGWNVNSVFINGKPASSHIWEDGEWVHVIATLAAPSNTTFWLGDALTGNIGSATLFYQPIVGQEERIYRSYFGGQRAGVDETQGVGINESQDSWDVYSYTWTTIGG